MLARFKSSYHFAISGALVGMYILSSQSPRICLAASNYQNAANSAEKKTGNLFGCTLKTDFSTQLQYWNCPGDGYLYSAVYKTGSSSAYDAINIYSTEWLPMILPFAGAVAGAVIGGSIGFFCCSSSNSQDTPLNEVLIHNANNTNTLFGNSSAASKSQVAAHQNHPETSNGIKCVKS